MNLIDLAYTLGITVTAPVWLCVPKARRKVLGAFKNRMGQIPLRQGNAIGILIHAVSVGEMNATRELIRQLRESRKPGTLHFIITATTDTGFARAKELYGDQADVTVVRFPLDFSWSVRRLLENQQVRAAILMELEVWPNFVRECAAHQIPVAVINGRLTEESFDRYQRIALLTRRMFRRLSKVCAQDDRYAKRFVELGVNPSRVSISGTMKFDVTEPTDLETKARELAAATGLTAGTDPIWVCGSTGPGEEEIVLDEYHTLLKKFPRLRLVIVPRHPPRFDEVAAVIAAKGFACLRRSQIPEIAPTPNAVVLGDSMGELRAWYSLADVVFVGRTLVDLGPRQHGSDMIEPATSTKPIIVGPFTSNFAEPMRLFQAADAIKVVTSGQALGKTVASLLTDRQAALELGRRAKQVVENERGATKRHVQTVLALL